MAWKNLTHSGLLNLTALHKPYPYHYYFNQGPNFATPTAQRISQHIDNIPCAGGYIFYGQHKHKPRGVLLRHGSNFDDCLLQIATPPLTVAIR